ncbi:hypothetical protein LCGC14_2534920 [marine sediment metagenome]|uniref:Uncharacterized protein n=1 Tax=marine sediment metagenome TaxID=412755 RepID=A0A0F9BFB9_9ZZZZ
MRGWGKNMHESYEDIRSRIKEKPSWYDENGVPRYGDFAPDKSPNIYADEVMLLQIACQNCSGQFKVEMNFSKADEMMVGRQPRGFSDEIRFWKDHGKMRGNWPPVHYGDPPNHGCIGDTMNCIDLRVSQLWIRTNKRDWHRLTDLEIELEAS